MNDTEHFRPLREVWLRPRRVSRELAREPLGGTDYVLAALQGVCNYLVGCRLQPEQKLALPLLLSNALLIGAVTGLLATWFYAIVYCHLGTRAGRIVGRRPVFHVLSYGAVPVVAALLLSLGSALVVGDAILIRREPPELDRFVLIVSRVELSLVFALYFWSYLLQVMGLSELFGISVLRAFMLWLLGQLIVGALAAILLELVLLILFPALLQAG